LAYALLQAGVFRGASYGYTLLGIFAASCVLISLLDAFNMAALVINGSWVLLGVYGMSRLFFLEHGVRFSEEERAFLDAKLPDLTKSQARRFLRAGIWVNGAAGTTLTTEGDVNATLFYLPSGQASVFVQDTPIATVRPSSFIGEMTALSGDPATATVILEEDTQYFCMNGQRLRDLVARDVDLRRVLEVGFSRDMRRKLENNNRALRRSQASCVEGPVDAEASDRPRCGSSCEPFEAEAYVLNTHKRRPPSHSHSPSRLKTTQSLCRPGAHAGPCRSRGRILPNLAEIPPAMRCRWAARASSLMRARGLYH